MFHYFVVVTLYYNSASCDNCFTTFLFHEVTCITIGKQVEVQGYTQSADTLTLFSGLVVWFTTGLSSDNHYIHASCECHHLKVVSPVAAISLLFFLVTITFSFLQLYIIIYNMNYYRKLCQRTIDYQRTKLIYIGKHGDKMDIHTSSIHCKNEKVKVTTKK